MVTCYDYETMKIQVRKECCLLGSHFIFILSGQIICCTLLLESNILCVLNCRRYTPLKSRGCSLKSRIRVLPYNLKEVFYRSWQIQSEIKPLEKCSMAIKMQVQTRLGTSSNPIWALFQISTSDDYQGKDLNPFRGKFKYHYGSLLVFQIPTSNI